MLWTVLLCGYLVNKFRVGAGSGKSPLQALGKLLLRYPPSITSGRKATKENVSGKLDVPGPLPSLAEQSAAPSGYHVH